MPSSAHQHRRVSGTVDENFPDWESGTNKPKNFCTNCSKNQRKITCNYFLHMRVSEASRIASGFFPQSGSDIDILFVATRADYIKMASF